MAEKKLTAEVMTRISHALKTTLAETLPRGFSIVLVIDDGNELAVASPEGVLVVRAILASALERIGPTDAPAAIVEVKS